MEVIDITEDWLNKTVKVIKSGGMVVFPSDTVYILVVDPTNQKAVDKLLAFKNRWAGKAISVAVTDKKMAKDFVEFGESEEKVYGNLLPGPFTVVSRGKHRMSQGIEAEDGTLGVRIPDNQHITKLVKKLGKPITATSANLSGRTPHYSLESFLKTISQNKKKLIDLAVDGGKLPRNKPSTVIDITGSEVKVLRRGDLVTGKSQSLVTHLEKETMKIGVFLVKRFLDSQNGLPLVMALSGDLGCGKTVFTRGVAKELGIKERIKSPTFNIINQYSITNNKFHSLKTLVHMDLYRLETEQDFESIKFLDLFKPGVIAAVEWPENMGEKLWEKLKTRAQVKVIRFKYIDQTTREIEWG